MRGVSIKARLYILILTILIPLVILQAMGIASKYKQNIDLELNANEDFARAVSFAFTNYLENIWDTEYAIGLALMSHSDVHSAELEEYMRKVSSSQPGMLRYSWLSPEGVVIASVQHKSSGMFLCDRDYVRRINQGEEKVLTGIIEGRLSDHIVMPVARGIWRDRKLIGIVVAAVDVGMIEEVLPRNRAGRTSLFGLIDENGRIVYLSGSSDMAFNERMVRDSSPVWDAFQGKIIRGVYTEKQSDGNLRMGVHMPVSNTGWVCFASITVDEALEKSWQEVERSIWFLLLVVAISLAGVGIISRGFVDSITTLQRAAQSILNGDLTVRTHIKGEDELAKAGKAFDKMADHIEQLEENRRFFLQVSAHELRNPMAGIKGITSIIRRRVDSGKSLEKTLPMIETLEKEVDRLSKLLNQILGAFSAQTGKPQFETHFQPVNIIDVVASALKPFQIEESSHEFIFEIPDIGPLWVTGDPERLEDVFRNLLRNAVKYSPAESRVNVRICSDDTNITILIRDEGIGIPEGQISRVFESFYRGDNFNGSDPGGMGLGLYICRDNILRHGGSVWVENNEGKGCTFHVRLPLLKEKINNN